MLATDSLGQSTLTGRSALNVDGQPPSVALAAARHGHVVKISVRDGGSGVRARTVSVSFGDGQRASGRTRFTHHYRHPGVYAIVVRAADKLGNRALIRRPVSIR